MGEVLRDLDYETKVNGWRRFFGYRTPEDAEATLLDRSAVWETILRVSQFNGFPSTPFKIQIGTEKMEVTRITGHVMEVRRGVEATNIQVHDAGDKISVCSP
jgi:hypothetical protein